MARIIHDLHAVGTGAHVRRVGRHEAQVRAVVVAARIHGGVHQCWLVHVHAWVSGGNVMSGLKLYLKRD